MFTVGPIASTVSKQLQAAGGVHVLLLMLLCLMGAVSSLTAQDETAPTWTSFVGTWRFDPSTSQNSYDAPFALVVWMEGEELVMARRALLATETYRYRTDGAPTKIVQGGRPFEATASIEDRGLVIKSRLVAPGTAALAVTEVYAIRRRQLLNMTIDRTTVAGSKTTTSHDLLRKVPGPPIRPEKQP